MHRLPLILVATVAWALPPERSSEGTDDDASVTVSLLDRAIRGDVRSWCSMRVLIRGEARELRQDDTVRLRLREDDVVGDDTLWETNFEVTRDEAAAQRVDRRFDCSSNFGDGDAAGDLEIYAVANVNKQSCGAFCNEDDPTTDNIAVALVDDDDSEENDGSGAAAALPLGATRDRIARDGDWFAVNFLDRSQVTLRASHRPAGGRVDLALFDPMGGQLQVGMDEDDGSVVQTAALPPGEYRARVQPRDGNNFNFYDLELQVVVAGCEPGAIEVQPCGNCGNRRRECGDDSDWGVFGECVGVGECAPGDERAEVCGLCGREAQTCSDECRWIRGDCGGEGDCMPGAQDSAMCAEGGVRLRTCEETCAWGAFGDCDDRACADGDEQPCYDGPEDTEGVGACAGGMQVCDGGAWGPCEGEVRPSAEVCDDGVDNNCDGAQDMADEACDETPEVGDACDGGEDDCGDQLECLRPPDAPGFIGGYCGVAGCDADCPEGSVCGTVFGERYCLQPCDRHSECRADYRCADVSPGQMACIPACQRDVDCRDPAQPVCDRREGLCVADDAQIDLDRTPDPRDMGRDPPPPPPPPRDGGGGAGGAGGDGDGGAVGAEGGTAEPVGCSCDVGGSGFGFGLWLLLLAGVGRRRRRG